ncbi:tetratricopeptide repeat protein [Fadolivirus algeromassiliense]|jgi:hypothetical protein|uniref:Tetratricopeptide repeat protein n=1 Tax=Fadolivirus FV1/VV64 TaxID=3070911 RepID=A0A7D3QWE4_9VIRU|nr:tetratricopeptide repeat protein [Fadolivirus algeromassiliense]QKF93540.1 tetratricopeptide repeat protein [Fadolivirus FV1/VV64]
MTDKRKFIQEYLTNNGYDFIPIDDKCIPEIYNLYKFNKIPSQINKDLYGWYAVYFEVNDHTENAIKFNEYALKHDSSDSGAFRNLFNIYLETKDHNNLIQLYNTSIQSGVATYIKDIVKLYKDNNNPDDIVSMFTAFINDEQKYKYLVSVCDIPDFKFTKEMVDTLFKLDLKDDAPLSLKLMKSIFSSK